MFRVNWFRKDENGKFLWPGYGENIRVLRWILDRVRGKGSAVQTPIGYLPTPQSIDSSEMNLKPHALQQVLSLDFDGWKKEVDDIEEFFSQFKDRLPVELRKEVTNLKNQLSA